MKSQVTTLVDVAVCIILDAAASCAVTNHARDLETLRQRVKHEGLSFLTISLPTLGKDFERSLDQGRIEPTCFRSFRKRGKIPAFLQGFFALVFNTATGGLLDDPKIEAIVAIRQIAYCFKKLKVPCTSRRTNKAIQEFKQCELDLQEAMAPGDVEYFLNVSRVLWSMSIGRELVKLSPTELIPKHGPGSTEEKILGNQKFFFFSWHDRLEPYFPVVDFALANANAVDSPWFEFIKVVDEEQEKPVRVITVPKTLKSPRIIAIEPVCMQYTQQAVSKALIRVLETSDITGGHINFRDQHINQELALISSKYRRFATLDLSSASDRVPYDLAIRMFDCAPDFRDAISACRSRRAKLPNGEVLALSKFASMGSALCFPVESMYFYTICVMALLGTKNLPVTPRNIRKMARQVWVYGDDIVVPTHLAAVVSDYLHKYFCKVNTSKSFWTGKFRESCGVDAYDGELVTPVYLRSTCPSKLADASELISWVKASNAFYLKGYWLTADLLNKQVCSITGALPVMRSESPGLSLVSCQRGFYAPHGVKTRFNSNYQRLEVKSWCVEPVRQDDVLFGYPALLKCLLRLQEASLQEIDKEHLNKSVRRGAVTLKSRWISANY